MERCLWDSAGIGVAFSDTQGRLLVSNVDVRNIIEGNAHRIWVVNDNSAIISFTGDMRQPKSIQSRLYAPVKGNYPLKDAIAVYGRPRTIGFGPSLMVEHPSPL